MLRNGDNKSDRTRAGKTYNFPRELPAQKANAFRSPVDTCEAMSVTIQNTRQHFGHTCSIQMRFRLAQAAMENPQGPEMRIPKLRSSGASSRRSTFFSGRRKVRPDRVQMLNAAQDGRAQSPVTKKQQRKAMAREVATELRTWFLRPIKDNDRSQAHVFPHTDDQYRCASSHSSRGPRHKERRSSRADASRDSEVPKLQGTLVERALMQMTGVGTGHHGRWRKQTAVWSPKAVEGPTAQKTVGVLFEEKEAESSCLRPDALRHLPPRQAGAPVPMVGRRFGSHG